MSPAAFIICVLPWVNVESSVFVNVFCLVLLVMSCGNYLIEKKISMNITMFVTVTQFMRNTVRILWGTLPVHITVYHDLPQGNQPSGAFS